MRQGSPIPTTKAYGRSKPSRLYPHRTAQSSKRSRRRRSARANQLALLLAPDAKKRGFTSEDWDNGAPGGIRTHDHQLRRQVLYPAELQAQTLTINDLRSMTSLDVTVDVTVGGVRQVCNRRPQSRCQQSAPELSAHNARRGPGSFARR